MKRTREATRLQALLQAEREELRAETRGARKRRAPTQEAEGRVSSRTRTDAASGTDDVGGRSDGATAMATETPTADTPRPGLRGQCNPTHVPITRQAHKDAVENDEPLGAEEATIFRSFVGKLNWLSTTTHPKLAMPHSILAGFNRAPTKGAWCLLKSTLRYCKQVMSEGLASHTNDSSGLQVWTDADWAGSYSIDGTTESRTGVIVLHNSMPVAWASSKQKSIALSSAQAELQAMSTGAQIGLHCWHVAQELGIQVAERLDLNVDASAAVSFAQKIGSKTKMKHLDIRREWIQQLRDRDTIKINKVGSKEQKADALTKLMGRKEYHRASECLQNELNSPPNLD